MGFGLIIDRNTISTAIPRVLGFNCAFNLFQESCFRSLSERARETVTETRLLDFAASLPYNEATSRRRVSRKQPDLTDPLKSKKAVTVTVAVASSMRASLTARFITPLLSAFTGFRSTERRLLFHPPNSHNVVVVRRLLFFRDAISQINRHFYAISSF